MENIGRLREFVRDMTQLVERHGADEPRMLDEGEKLLRALVAQDDWLPEEFAAPSPESYRQYLLYCDKGVMSRLHAHHLLSEGHANVRVYRPS